MYHDSRAITICTNLWPDWSIRILIATKGIFSRIQLGAQKPFVRWQWTRVPHPGWTQCKCWLITPLNIKGCYKLYLSCVMCLPTLLPQLRQCHMPWYTTFQPCVSIYCPSLACALGIKPCQISQDLVGYPECIHCIYWNALIISDIVVSMVPDDG